MSTAAATVGRLIAAGMVLALFSALEAWAEYQSKGKRDPFVPLVTQDGRRIQPPGLDEEIATAADGLRLQGVVLGTGEKKSFAIINDRILKEQDELDGVKVLKIAPNSVTILVNGREHHLTVHQPTEENSTP